MKKHMFLALSGIFLTGCATLEPVYEKLNAQMMALAGKRNGSPKVQEQTIPAEFLGKWSALEDVSGKPYSAKERKWQCEGRGGRSGGDSDSDVYVLTVKTKQINYASYVEHTELKVLRLSRVQPGYIAGNGVMEVWGEGSEEVEEVKIDFSLKREGKLLFYKMGEFGTIRYGKCEKQ